MNVDNNKNWQPWIYFEGDVWGADKIGNINLGYVGSKMGFADFMVKNFATADKYDEPAVDLGMKLAKVGR